MRKAEDAVEIVFEDDDILVVNKPAGMYVHPAPGHEDGTLTDFILKTHPSIAGVGSRERPGIVHRLDAETSGVMVLAKTRRSYLNLREQFERHDTVGKVYLAVLHGTPKPRSGEIRNLIGRKNWDAKRMAVVEEGGQIAISKYKVVASKGPLSLVEFRIETGRTHQIRVHAAFIGHPVVGDALYGNGDADRRLRIRPTRQLLHAYAISFLHPASGDEVTFSAYPPEDIVFAM